MTCACPWFVVSKYTMKAAAAGAICACELMLKVFELIYVNTT